MDEVGRNASAGILRFMTLRSAKKESDDDRERTEKQKAEQRFTGPVTAEVAGSGPVVPFVHSKIRTG